MHTDTHIVVYGYIIITLWQSWKNKDIKGTEHINQIYTVALPHSKGYLSKRIVGKCMVFK